MTRVAVDLGTNTLRWMIDSGDGTPTSAVRMCGLGRDLERARAFDPDALAAVDAGLAELAAELAGVDRPAIRAVATAVARRVDDVEPLATLVRTHLGVDLEVISGDDEAALAAAGVVAGLPDVAGAGSVVVVDIGGGSTEFVLVSDGAVTAAMSLDIGARTVTDQYLESDPPRASELSAALSVIELFLDDLRRDLPAIPDAIDDGATVVLVAGTATTVAAVEIGLLEWDPAEVHGFVLDKPAAEDVYRTLATESAEDRAFNPGLPADRVDVIVGGCCVLVETMRQLGLEEVTISVSDLLDGLLASVEG